ncbi:hypothetical protein [Nostoc sp. CALU 1950]|uniref:hypothetical protein n=1 Tax=Nostoc sp. CALU 1950 TaxID=3104321 RepID=UPI003EBBBF08
MGPFKLILAQSIMPACAIALSKKSLGEIRPFHDDFLTLSTNDQRPMTNDKLPMTNCLFVTHNRGIL